MWLTGIAPVEGANFTEEETNCELESRVWQLAVLFSNIEWAANSCDLVDDSCFTDDFVRGFTHDELYESSQRPSLIISPRLKFGDEFERFLVEHPQPSDARIVSSPRVTASPRERMARQRPDTDNIGQFVDGFVEVMEHRHFAIVAVPDPSDPVQRRLIPTSPLDPQGRFANIGKRVVSMATRDGLRDLLPLTSSGAATRLPGPRHFDCEGTRRGRHYLAAGPRLDTERARPFCGRRLQGPYRRSLLPATSSGLCGRSSLRV